MTPPRASIRRHPAAAALALGLAIGPLASPAAGAPALPAGFELRQLRLDGETSRYAVWLPPGYDRSRAWPCVVFLHGSGECGGDGVAPTRVGIGPSLTAHPERWPCVVVFPQKPAGEEEWEEREARVLATLEAVRGEFAVDSSRIALTGISQGGHGVWVLGARRPSLWSCLVAVCGYGRALTVASRVDGLPVWAFHGLADDVVSAWDTRQIVDALRARRGPADSTSVRMTLYPERGHDSWEPAFADPELPRWILAQRRKPAP